MVANPLVRILWSLFIIRILIMGWMTIPHHVLPMAWVWILDMQWRSAGYHRAGLRECPRGSSYCRPSGPTNEVLGMQKYGEWAVGSLGPTAYGIQPTKIEIENLEDINIWIIWSCSELVFKVTRIRTCEFGDPQRGEWCLDATCDKVTG